MLHSIASSNEILSAEPIAYDASVNHFLLPLQPWLQQATITEICVNTEKQVFIEQNSTWQKFEVPELTFHHLNSLSVAVATASKQEISARKPLLSASLPDGSRMQFLVPPAVSMGHSITIRKPSVLTRSLDQYQAEGFFNSIQQQQNQLSDLQKTLLQLKQNNQFIEFFKLAVLHHQNIVVGGKTGSGKTTFMKTLISEIPSHERLITIENVRELFLTQENKVHLLYSQGGQGIANISPKELLSSCLRMRPDRILLAELTGDECEEYIQIAASGHPGSITSMHSVTPALGFERMASMLRNRKVSSPESLLETHRRLKAAIDIFVQFQRSVSGERFISEIYYDPMAQLQASQYFLNQRPPS